MPRVCQVASHSLAASILSPFHALRNGLHKWMPANVSRQHNEFSPEIVSGDVRHSETGHKKSSLTCCAAPNRSAIFDFFSFLAAERNLDPQLIPFRDQRAEGFGLFEA